MWILADIGTTNAKFYRWDGKDIVLDSVVPSDELDEEVWMRFEDYEIKAGFSVRPDVQFPGGWVVIGRNEPWCFDISVDVSTVGVDRLLALEGACVLGVSDGIVAMFGTANVVNVLKGGVFIGGAIAPGYALQIDALFSGIPHLRNFSPKIPDAPVGTNTAEAIGAGIYWSHLMWLSAMKGYFDVDRVLITGGGAGAVRHLIQMLGFEFVATLIPMGMVSLLKRKKGGL